MKKLICAMLFVLAATITIGTFGLPFIPQTQVFVPQVWAGETEPVEDPIEETATDEETVAVFDMESAEPVEEVEEADLPYEAIWGENISFETEFTVKEGLMPYFMFTPKGVDKDAKRPLIVWMHGSGEVGVGYWDFLNAGLPYVLRNWSSEGFGAYILCPQRNSRYLDCDYYWSTDRSAEQVMELIADVVDNYNIDTDMIILCGHSLGSMGAEYIAAKYDGYFSKVVLFSSFDVGDVSNISVPIKGFVGNGDSSDSIEHMQGYFVETFGEDALTVLSTNHGGVPFAAFSLDEDGNNRSDVVEWMLSK